MVAVLVYPYTLLCPSISDAYNAYKPINMLLILIILKINSGLISISLKKI
jgi:hypothetical protein